MSLDWGMVHQSGYRRNYEISVDIKNKLVWFKCYKCDALISLDTPPEEAFDELWELMKSEHAH